MANASGRHRSGETPETAALRELEEETGVSAERVTIIAVTEDWIAYDLPVELIAKLWSGRYRGQRQKWFLMQFLGTDEHVQIETDHREFSKWSGSILISLRIISSPLNVRSIGRSLPSLRLKY